MKLLKFLIAAFIFSAVFSVSAQEGKPKKEIFFKVNEQEAKGVLGTFSDEELDALINEYKSGKSPKEIRYLWVIREAEMRRADAKAAERLFYVFLAVVLLVALILILLVRIYAAQRKLLEET